MHRVGRIVDWEDDMATVEVGLHQECVSGSCSDCHAHPSGRWTVQIPWPKEYAIGQRVLVRERRGVYRVYRWLGFIVAFCAVLALGQELIGATRVEGTPEQKVLIGIGLVAGFAAWYVLRAWAKNRPQFRVEALDRPVPGLTETRVGKTPPAFLGLGGMQKVKKQ